jgi:uroporphyrinogen decarboxylase
MEQITGRRFAELIEGEKPDIEEFFRHYCEFFREMTYDIVSYEYGIVEILPDSGAIMGGRPGPIQNRKDFEAYPWDRIPGKFMEKARPRFDALRKNMPEGMKAVGGAGYGVFEISEDLAGYEYLCFMMLDEPDLLRDIYVRIGDMMCEIWRHILEEYADVFVVCRMEDDLGFRSSTLISPENLRKYVFPQYARIIELIHGHGKPFLWHSCGNIFPIMDDVIALGVDAKHSNEDAIAPFEKWLELYNGRIGILGGIDVDILCTRTPSEIERIVFEKGSGCRGMSRGYALGSGNSIPDYVPPENYLAMIKATEKIRERESKM